MKKDYWNICFRNFRIFAVLCFLVFLFFLFSSGLSFATLIFLLVTVIWGVMSYMFKKHSPSVIIVAYIVLGLATVSNLFRDFSDPAGFNISSVLFYLIMIYLIQGVYKAHKQEKIGPMVGEQVPTNNTPTI